VRLDDAFRLLGGGSRLAPPRQQTMKATLDWSYGLLDEAEQAIADALAEGPPERVAAADMPFEPPRRPAPGSLARLSLCSGVRASAPGAARRVLRGCVGLRIVGDAAGTPDAR
jgi:hypothetical protein